MVIAGLFLLWYILFSLKEKYIKKDNKHYNKFKIISDIPLYILSFILAFLAVSAVIGIPIYLFKFISGIDLLRSEGITYFIGIINSILAISLIISGPFDITK